MFLKGRSCFSLSTEKKKQILKKQRFLFQFPQDISHERMVSPIQAIEEFSEKSIKYSSMTKKKN